MVREQVTGFKDNMVLGIDVFGHRSEFSKGKVKAISDFVVNRCFVFSGITVEEVVTIGVKGMATGASSIN